MPSRSVLSWALLVLASIAIAEAASPAAPGSVAPAAESAGGDWRYYASDAASTKYSPLAQIDRSNVERLAVAWRWPSIDYEIARAHGPLTTSNMLETTPIAIDGVLYVATGLGAAVAIDGATGKTLWAWSPFDGGAKVDRASFLPINRGLGSWHGPNGEERLLLVSRANLVSLDAKTGKPDPAFGAAANGGATTGAAGASGAAGAPGRVDLRALGEGREPYASYFWTSPPLVCGDVVVVGNSTTDPYNFKSSPPGTIRGYDVRSGRMLWLFDIVPRRGQVGYDSWLEGSADYTGHGNVWTWMSCDPELGYVYAPTSTPTDDWYGGHRPGDGLFGESLVALDARTGQRVWHFQAVHHGLWDYDFPAAPILIDVTVGGQRVKAVAQISKQAFTYVLDRVTGKPLWPIEERPVPQSSVPGERTSPTQPHPTRPPAFDIQGLTENDLNDLTPELHAEALAIFARYDHGPVFLPPTVAPAAGSTGGKLGALQMPGPVGGCDWNGAAVDPETGILYVPSVSAPFLEVVAPPPSRGDVRYMIQAIGFVDGPRGKAAVAGKENDPLPLTRPPWGRVTAIDLNRGETLWIAANGDGPRDHPALAGLDLPPLGQRGRASPLLTKTLLFLPEGSKDMIAVPEGGGGRLLRAFDKSTGAVLSKVELPAGATGAPMTYLAGGKQYVVVPVGERDHEGELVALAVQ
jgi:quinoprotein glucose dehydrogenase